MCDHELNVVIQEEIARLPEKHRAAVVLCYLEGLTHEMAAERLGWPVGSVKSRLAWARERLRAVDSAGRRADNCSVQQIRGAAGRGTGSRHAGYASGGNHACAVRSRPEWETKC